ncbi:MAG: type II toxin-antitoxin system HicA family toxin [Bacteroidetes bacterium]|nr:type II toxin-antitoxin system HicA family toxin [Bacteroidota bacterium]
MTKRDKSVERLLNSPKDFTYSELKTLLSQFGYVEFVKGKTSGSRRAYYKEENKHLIRLHKPHPGETLKKYQIEYVVSELKKEGLL